jgi:Holliday junction resolvasome RuvABC DNA-binding subunit
MSELQNEGFTAEPASTVNIEASQPEPIENPDKGTDLATENVQAEVKVEPTEEEKEAKRQAAFNKQYGEKKQAERERDAARARIEELEQAKTAQTPNEIGDVPSEYDYDTDEEYTTAKAKYASNIRADERYKLQQESGQTFVQQQEQAEQHRQQEKFNTDIQAYTKSAENLGIDRQELQQAANAVQSYGITPNLSLAILEDPDGPLMTKYLAANPQEVTKLVNMNPYSAGSYLANLRSKAAALKPKASSTPAPTQDISGSGGEPERTSPLLKGATFE